MPRYICKQQHSKMDPSVCVQAMGPAGHRRLQEAPSSKFLMHNNSVDRQMQMSRAADMKEAQSGLFNGPQSSDFNIKASS